MAVPTPTNVEPWYLRNINQALALDTATGNVYLRTGFAGNIIISGNVNIPGTVDSHITEVGTSGVLATPWLPVSIDGNSAVTAVVTGSVAASQSGAWTVGLTGNLAGVTAPVTVVDGGGSITVDGTVGVSGTVNANITGGNVTVQQGTNPWLVDGTVSIVNTPTVSISGINVDAFGRLRVSNPYTLFDSQNLYLDGGQFDTATVAGGSVTYVPNQSSFNLSVSTNSGDSVIRQSWTTQAYQPGKSLLVLNTFAFSILQAGLTQRVGYFTDRNGVYFEAVGGTLNMVIRSYTTGVVTETRIPQASWNGDTLTGAGPSGITLDPTTVQIFWTDIEWLGVGNVRVGFIINGVYILCHTFQHANIVGNTTVYMTTATLNPRYEIFNTANTGVPSTMKQICSTVISEGGYNPSLSVNYVSSGTTTTRVAAANTLTSIASIRLNPLYPDAVVIPAQIDILSVDVRYGEFVLLEGATVPGITWTSPADSVVQTSTTMATVAGGTVVYGGLTSSRSTVEISEELARRLQLRRSISGAPVTLTLAVAYTQTNSDILWKFGWQELTN